MIKRYEPQPGIRATKVRDEGLDPLQVCKVCEKIPNASEVVASPSSILRHLLDVHGIAEPNFDKHYAPKRLPGTDL
ncbi:hypothetical protein FRC11_002775 [Ceratobasidium sp. 423]|nr:hypothetical protein FRC11_002775 [Ceratobasidium sp. 423]